MQDTRATLDEYRTNVLESWNDDRIVPKAWVDTHIWFFLHLYADLNQIGATLDGFNFRQSPDDTLLILKLTKEDLPYVVFVGSSDPTHCMSKLKRQLRAGDIRLLVDQYR